MLINQAVILCGGLGSRLGDLTKSKPKPLMDINDKSFLDHLIQETSRYGFDEILLLAGYKGNVISEKYHGKCVNNCSIKVSVEEELMGTSGCLRYSKNMLQDRFVLMNGDSWLDFDLSKIRNRSPEYIDIVVKHTDDAYDCGVFSIHNDIINGFCEKQFDHVPGVINTGIYVINKINVIDEIPDGVVSLEKQTIPSILKKYNIGAIFCDNSAYFIDIGTPDRYQKSQKEFVQARTKPALFLDRDGTLNVDHGYTHRSQDLEWIPGAKELIRHANNNGYYVFVVTNQSGIARGYYTQNDVHEFHKTMQTQLVDFGAHVDGFMHCPFHPDGTVQDFSKNSELRKPNPGMINKILDDWPILQYNSIMIGDMESDVLAGKSANLTSYMFNMENLYEFYLRIVYDRK